MGGKNPSPPAIVNNKTDPSTTVFDTDKTPDFIGLSLRKAYQKARSKNVILKVKGSGLVRKSRPSPGQALPKGRQVQLVMSH